MNKHLLFWLMLLPLLLFDARQGHSQVISKTDTLPSGELMLSQRLVIEAPVERVWEAYTLPDVWKAWVSPVVEIDFRINGRIQSHYDSTAVIGDPGTITTHILHYIPYKQIAMQAELNEQFPAFMKEEEKNLYSVVDFEALNDQQTRLTVYGIGYKNTKPWQDLMGFFIQANEQSLNTLKAYL
jgi:uncharacterized protein YndB with AHSA1/START domain